MSRVSVRKLTNPTNSEIEAAVTVMNEAFDGQRSIELFTGGDKSLVTPYWRANILAALHSGEVWVASDGTEAIMSIGIWFGPGKELYETKEIESFLELVSHETREWWITKVGHKAYRPLCLKFFGDCLGVKTRIDNWFANVIATHPRYQGRGLATAHIEGIHQKVMREGSYLALGTSGESQERFYRSVGFWERGRMKSEPSDLICFFSRSTAFLIFAITLKLVLLSVVNLRRAEIELLSQRAQSYSYLGDDYPPTWNIGKITTVKLMHGDTSHYELEGPIADMEWDALTPNNGTVYLGPKKMSFSVSMFHQLRCLNIIRKESNRKRHLEGDSQDEGGRTGYIPSELANHCMNYLRQMIICRADTVLDAVKGIPRVDVLREETRCRDWTQVYDAAEKAQPGQM
ncbi:hypothetical protein D9758_015771 [Tetrapyrgos nigripes]|uniref:N-acetyltransferase domain-containing protein n=1 Tax=Tetrapyrgos nigripes TaxID=182062 RepID=A0A8H5FFI4_9AGAR|nr:hypothetical protein D9758_015771 [Tetrapyrgos nigripes]